MKVLKSFSASSVLGVLLGVATFVQSRPAAAANPVAIAFKVAGVLKDAYSATKWWQCAVGGTGALCPESEVVVQADRVIRDIESVIIYTDQSNLMGQALSLMDQAAIDYYDLSLLSPDTEADLVAQAISVYNAFYAHFNNINPNNQAQADEAYALLQTFNVVAALTDRILRTAQSRHMISLDPAKISMLRERTVATNYAMVGWPQVEILGPGIIVDTEQTFDNNFYTKGIAKHLFNYGYHWSDSTDCNLSQFFSSPPGQICRRNSNGCFWGICLARVVPDNATAVADAMGDIMNRIHGDPVVKVAQTAIQILASAGYDRVSERYSPWTTGRIIPLDIDIATLAPSFDMGDGPSPYPYANDWAYGQYKGQCQSGNPATGLSVDPQSGRAHSVLCESPLPYPIPFWGDGPLTTAQTFIDTNSAGYGARGDWDPNFYKGECTDGQFVTGIAQDPWSGTVTRIECSMGQTGVFITASNTCEVIALRHPNSGNVPDELPGYAWAPGYDMVQCPAGKVITGVSTYSPWSDGNLINHPHSILCCEVQEAP